MRLRRQLIGSGRGGIGPCALPRDESANLQTQLPSKPRGEGPGAVHRAQKLSYGTNSPEPLCRFFRNEFAVDIDHNLD